MGITFAKFANFIFFSNGVSDGFAIYGVLPESK